MSDEPNEEIDFSKAARLLASAGFQVDEDAPPAEHPNSSEGPRRRRIPPQLKFLHADEDGEHASVFDADDPRVPEEIRFLGSPEVLGLAAQFTDVLSSNSPANVLAALALAVVGETTARGATPRDVVVGGMDAGLVFALLVRMTEGPHQFLNVVAGLLFQFAVLHRIRQQEKEEEKD